MRKIILSAALSVSLLVSPIVVLAQSTDQDAVIAALRAQVQQLQQQIDQMLHPQGSNSSPTNTTPANELGSEPAPTCPQLYLSRTLSLGMSGEDVRSLQNFLISQGFLAAGNNTGYFGPATEAAVKAFQTQQGIEPLGIAGPRTRAAIVTFCSRDGAGTTPGNPEHPAAFNFTASPLSGAAPLSVAFSAQVSGNNHYSINFGDSMSGTMQNGSCTGGCNPFPISSSHTYTAPGTYTAKLYDTLRDCAAGVADCSVASVTITVSNTSQGGVNFSSSPTSGTVPLTTTFTANSLASSGTYYIEYGDNTSMGTICNQDSFGVANCGTHWSGTHTYQAAGTYTAKLLYAPHCVGDFSCVQSLQTVSSVTITVSSTGQNTISWSATPTSGTQPLTVSFSSSIAGVVNFGDGQSGTLNPAPVCFSCTPVWTLGHTYASAGTYSASILVNNTLNIAPITITVSAANAATYSISSSVSTTPGLVNGSWSTTGAANSDDWIALVPTGTTWSQSQPTSQMWVWATSNSKTKNNATASSGNVSFSAVPSSAQYQLVYYLNTKDASGNYIEKARSNTFSAFYPAD